jgi:FkbM family methyltransferase
MGVTLTNVINGIGTRLKRRKVYSRFPAISWLQLKILKHQEDTSIKTVRLGALNIVYRRPYELRHTYEDLFLHEIYSFKAARPDPFIIDCGANIGISVLYFKSIYPKARVIAYEPDPGNYHILQQNIIANQLKDVEAIESAVWTENGTISFVAKGNEGSKITTADDPDALTIPTSRLAEVIENKKVDFLKIDIEGAELDVIKDCAPYLGNVENLFIEYHGKVSETNKLEEILGILRKHYRVYLKLPVDNLKNPFTEETTNGMFDVQLNVFCYR